MYKKIYINEPARRDLVWAGNSREVIAGFPKQVRILAGIRLNQLQAGEIPEDFKVMGSIGQGVYELRLRDRSGQYRVIYLTKLQGLIVVLHCFQKKTAKTARRDLELARTRYREFIHGHKDPE